LLTVVVSAGLLAVPQVLRAEGPTTKPAAKADAPATKPARVKVADSAGEGTGGTKPATKPSKPLSLAATAKPISASPESISELKAIEQRVEEVTRTVMPAVVGITVGSGQGSGVIVSPDGYVLTAAHVSGEANIDISLTMPDGRRVKAKTLGLNKGIDSGLCKITEPGEWPYCEIGKSGDLKKGQWVLALGHPGGYRRDRPPVLRLGRILSSTGPNDFIMTDCTLVGGDSGGPLFDLDGKVVGIHSRIGPSTLNNMHVPADTYTQTWDRLAKGELWGERFAFISSRGPMLGLGGESMEGGGAKITTVAPDGPAAKAGMKNQE